MYSKPKKAERWIAAALAAAVFSVGMVVSYVGYKNRSNEHRQALADTFQDTAQHYSWLVQRQLDIYAATNRSLAAYVAASSDIDSKSMSTFIDAGHYFAGLKGISSLGYLPRVPRGGIAAFERAARREFPGYRVRNALPGAKFVYPMLYAQNATDPERPDALRGIDFSAIPERRAAIMAAEAANGPAVSDVHAALGDPNKPPVLVTFTPVRSAVPGGDKRAGVVFSIMKVNGLFEDVDNGRIGKLFDLEVYEDTAGHQHVVYDADGVMRANSARQVQAYVHRGMLRYANRQFTFYLFAKPEYLTAQIDRTSWMVLALGALLSLIAANAAFRSACLLLARQNSAELTDRFEAFFEAHPFAVYSMDRERRLTFVNQKMVQELGVERARLIGEPIGRFIAPENQAMAAGYFEQVLAGNAVAYNNRIVKADDGQGAELAIVLIPIRSGGEVSRVLGFAENISERKRFERELFESRQMLQHILDTIPQRVFWKDRNCAYLGANRSLLEEAGIARIEDLIGRTDHDLLWQACARRFQEEDRQVMQSASAMLNIQQSIEHPDGTVSWYEVNKVPLTDAGGTVVGVLGVSREITENKRLEHELVRRANYDSLTGLPNRAFFYSELQQALKRAQRRSGVLALMYFDIDRFKLINDSYGHDVGDTVIRTFASRVRTALRQSDFIARLGGDEFVLIVEELASGADAAAVAEKLLAAVRDPFQVEARSLDVSTSIGIAILQEGMLADQLVKAADDAMYEAKRAGRNCFRQGVGAWTD